MLTQNRINIYACITSSFIARHKKILILMESILLICFSFSSFIEQARPTQAKAGGLIYIDNKLKFQIELPVGWYAYPSFIPGRYSGFDPVLIASEPNLQLDSYNEIPALSSADSVYFYICFESNQLGADDNLIDYASDYLNTPDLFPTGKIITLGEYPTSQLKGEYGQLLALRNGVNVYSIYMPSTNPSTREQEIFGILSSIKLLEESPLSIPETERDNAPKGFNIPKSTSQTTYIGEMKFPWDGDKYPRVIFTGGPHTTVDSQWEQCNSHSLNRLTALDFGLSINSDVLSVQGGQIIYVCRGNCTWIGGGGEVVVRHGDGWFTRYWHLDTRSLNWANNHQNMDLPQGTILGTTLLSHVHLELRTGFEAPPSPSSEIGWHGIEIDEYKAYSILDATNNQNGLNYQGTLIQGTPTIQPAADYKCTSRTRLGQKVTGWKTIEADMDNYNSTLISSNRTITAILYDNPNYQGYQLPVNSNGDNDLCDNIIIGQTSNPNPCFDPNVITWNDRASSIVLAPGYTAVLALHSKDWDIDQYGQSQSRFKCGTDIPDFSPLLFDGTTIPLDNNISKILIEKCTLGSNNINQDLLSDDPCSPISPPSLPDNASDLTLQTDHVLAPGEVFEQVWHIRNTGSSTWGSGYLLHFYDGDQMGAPTEINVPPTAPGQVVDLSVNLNAPTNEGNYTGYWQLQNSQGTHFGPVLHVKVTVQSGSPPAEGDISLTCLDCPSVLTPGQTYRPTIRATVNQGQLLESRGDLLRNTDGNLYGAWPHVAVVGTVSAGQSYDFTFYADNPLTAPLGEGSYDSRWRIWRDGNWAGPEINIHFDVRAGGGIRPSAPTLSSPGDWHVSRDGSTPTLCANQVGGMQYYFQIYESHDIPESSWISSNCWTPPTLGYFTYKWHVKIKDPGNGLESDWSVDWHFSIDSPYPSLNDVRFDPGSPSANTIVHVYACADEQYELYINTATDGSANGTWRMVTNALPRGCDPGNHANWIEWFTLGWEDGNHLARFQVFKNGQALNVYDWTYSLQRRPPNGVQLVFPSRDSWLNSRTVNFAWQPSSRVTTYELVVSLDADQHNRILDEYLDPSITNYTHTFNQDYELLYWSVNASNELGTQGSGAWEFHLDRVNPISGVTAPNGVVYETAFPVTWSGSDDRSGIRWYDVQYRDGNRPDSLWVDWMTNVSQISSIFIGQSGHTYYFRSRALDVAGNLKDWPGGDGDTYATIDPSAQPSTPWWDANYGYKRNLLILNNDSNSLSPGYPAHLHFDTGTTPSSTELYAASQSAVKGDDFRIIYNNTTELSRFVQAFDSAQIDIWFNLQVAIGPNPGSDGASYQLYFGNPSASSPPSDPNNVFFPAVDGNTVGLWRFSEGNGSAVHDFSGYGNDGSAMNLGWAQGKFGWSGVFNGTNTVINAGTSDLFNFTQFTAEAWVYINIHQGETSILRKEASDTSLIYDVIMDAHKVVLRLNGNSCNVEGNTELQTGRWYFMAWTYDGATAKVYLNGSLDGSNYCGNALRTGYTPLYIGADGRSNNKYLNGSLQLVRMSNIARDSFGYGGYADILAEPSLAAGDPITPPLGGQADLAILGLSTYPNPDGGILVQATFQNQGNISTQNGFYTDLYVDHLPTGTGDYTGSISFWVNDPIAAGTVLTLTTVIEQLPSAINNVLAPTSETTSMLYAQIDSSGAVNETDDSNNIYSSGMQVCTATPDLYESDNDRTSASAIMIGQAQTHNFTELGDQDWIRFEAQEGITYTLRTFSLGRSADTYLYLYDTDGVTLLASNDDSGGSLASQLVWQAPTTGTYYVLIRHWNPNVGGCGTRYSFTVFEGEGYRIYLPSLHR